MPKFDFNKEMSSYLSKKKVSGDRFSELMDHAQKSKGEEQGDHKVVIVKEESSIKFHIDKALSVLRKGKKEEKEEEKSPEENEEKEEFEEVRDIDESELEDMDEKGESFLDNIFNKIKSFFTVEQYSEEEFEGSEGGEEKASEENISKEDMKEMARFTQHVISKLHRKHIEELKKSKEFEKYKGILRKYKLVKEKE